jgi:hypothetical protein
MPLRQAPGGEKLVTIHFNYLAAHEAAISERVPPSINAPLGLEPSTSQSEGGRLNH